MRREWLILFVAFAIAFGGCAAAVGTSIERDVELLGVVNAAANADLPFWMPRLGVNADLSRYLQNDPEPLAAELARMEAAGITWVRTFVDWRLIEAQPGVFDWHLQDQIAAAIAERPTLRWLPVLIGAPEWARLTQEQYSTTADPAALATFASAFARRYGAIVDHYQIGDEPNLFDAWGGEPRPAAYAAQLQAAYHAIHQTDAQAHVIAAALAPTAETGPRNISDLLYLDDLYRIGLAEFSDGIAAKPYGFTYPPDDRTFDPSNPSELKFARAAALREIMLRHGDERTPLWGSSFGWNHLPAGWTGRASIWGQVSVEDQQAYTLEALRIAELEWPWLGGLILENWQPPQSADETDPRWGFALIEPDGTPSDLYNALTARDISRGAPPGLHFPASSFAAYSGVWTFGELGADLGWVGDSEVIFTFTGTEISLLLREDDYVAYLYPVIDGQPANALPRDANGRAYIVLTSDSREPKLTLVPIARDLSPGTHTLHLTADRGWDRWALAGFAVGQGDLAEPYHRQIALACLTAGVALAAAVVTAAQLDWSHAACRLDGLGQRLSTAGQILLGAAASLVLMIGMLLTWTDAAPNLFRREPIQLLLAILTAGLLYINPTLIVSLLAAAVLFLIFFQRSLLGLALTLFFAPFFLFPVELYRFAFPMSELLLLLTAGAWAMRTGIAWARRFRARDYGGEQVHIWTATGLDAAVIGYIVLGVLAFFGSAYQTPAWTELRTIFLEPALFYLVLRTSRPRREDLVMLVDALLASGTAVAIIGLVLYVGGQGVITAEEGARRLASVYGSPNNVGLWMGRCLPFALALTLVSVDTRRRIAAAVICVIMLAATALTQSAGALFLGLPAGVAVVILILFGRRALLPLTALIGLAVLAVPILAQSPRFARLLDPTDGTNFIRLRVWQSALSAIQDRPLTGLGLDQFLYFYRGRYIRPDAWLEPDLSHPHNIVLDFWLRLGIFGVLLIAWSTAAFYRALLPAIRALRAHDALLTAVAVGAAGSMANLLTHGMVDNSVFVNDLAYVFILLLGMAAALKVLAAADS